MLVYNSSLPTTPSDFGETVKNTFILQYMLGLCAILVGVVLLYSGGYHVIKFCKKDKQLEAGHPTHKDVRSVSSIVEREIGKNNYIYRERPSKPHLHAKPLNVNIEVNQNIVNYTYSCDQCSEKSINFGHDIPTNLCSVGDLPPVYTQSCEISYDDIFSYEPK